MRTQKKAVNLRMDVKEKQLLKWVKAVKKNADKKAADKLISHYLDEMFGYVYKRVDHRETAKDITQEIFISMLKSIKSYDDSKSAFRTWLYSIASRRIADYYREQEKDAELTDLAEIAHRLEDLTARNTEITRELAEIREFIDGLEPVGRAIFKAKVFDGQTFAEIALAEGIPESTVKSSFYATQKLIRREFKERSDDYGTVN